MLGSVYTGTVVYKEPAEAEAEARARVRGMCRICGLGWTFHFCFLLAAAQQRSAGGVE